MFCSNCGKEIPNGSKFCANCGAKMVGIESPARPESSVREFGFTENKGTDTVGKSSYSAGVGKLTFDWSNVTDEPVKRNIPDIRSPWDESETEEIHRVEKPTAEKRSTMSFIELLKQERQEKLDAAKQQSREYTERREPEADYSAFEQAPPVYVPPVYNDITRSSEAPVEALKFDEPVFDEPKYEAPVYGAHSVAGDTTSAPVYNEDIFEVSDIEEKEEYEAPVFAATPKPVEQPIEMPVEIHAEQPVFEPTANQETVSIADVAAAGESFETKAVKPEVADETSTVNVDAYYDAEKEMAASDPSNLDAELEAILNAGSTRISRAERHAAQERALAEEAAKLEALSSMAAPQPEPQAVEQPVEQPVNQADEQPVPVIKEEAKVEPVILEKDIQPAPARPADTYTEIEELKRRLAELTNTPEQKPQEEEKVPTVEDILGDLLAQNDSEAASAVAEPIAEAPSAVAEPIAEATVAATPITEASAVAEPIAEATVAAAPISEEPISLEELEKELLNQVTPESIEAEKTKKIDKFYTLYKKNEEFQRLLDEEYNKLKEVDAVADPEETVSIADVAAASAVGAVAGAGLAAGAGATGAAVEQAAVIEEPTPVPVFVDPGQTTAELLAQNGASQNPAATEAPAPVEEATPSKKELKAAAKAAKAAEKAAAKEAKRAAKQAGKADIESDEDSEEEGSSALTVIAVVIAILLVILLGIILILNFAPDSGIAIKIDSVIENIASYFSAADVMTDKFLI